MTQRCCMCHRDLAPGDDDGTGLAHRQCGRDEMDNVRNNEDQEPYRQVAANTTEDER